MRRKRQNHIELVYSQRKESYEQWNGKARPHEKRVKNGRFG